MAVFPPALSLPPRSVYDDLVAKGVIVPAQEVPPPTVPMDYSWARVGAMYVPHCVGREMRGLRCGQEVIAWNPWKAGLTW